MSSKKKPSLLVKACQKYEKDAHGIVTAGTFFLGIGKSTPSERMKAKIKRNTMK